MGYRDQLKRLLVCTDSLPPLKTLAYEQAVHLIYPYKIGL